jgi:SAM-dependent methyltransferase
LPVTDTSIAHDRVLTEEDQNAFQLRRGLAIGLEAFRQARGASPVEIHVLDYGCGRGRTVFWLLGRGYAACGVDVDARAVENGREFARQRRIDGRNVLSVLDAHGRSAHDDASFDFVMSHQVFEHVPDLGVAAREIARVTKPGGAGLHIYPARFSLFEDHLGMPFVHWLPKNAARRALIRLWVALGVEAKLPSYEGLDARERAEKFHRFTVEQTFYRGCREVKQAFADAGFEVSFELAQGVKDRMGILGRLPGAAALLAWLVSRFAVVSLACRKPASP